MTDDEIIAIRDNPRNTQGEALDWLAFGHAVAAAANLQAIQVLEALRLAPRGVSATADFDLLTWTFSIRADCRTAAGTYALVRVNQLSGAPIVGPEESPR